MLNVFTWIARGAALLLASLVLYSAAGPLATDDLWWHLGLGHAYAAEGPWLDGDPHLHTARHAPAPNAWLFDRVLAAIDAYGGLAALRGLHALIVAAILFGVWRLLRTRGESSIFASLGFGLFTACAAYRLLQLRPELATLLATVGLTLLILQRDNVPSGKRMAAVVGLCALWSNLHPGFLLGPVLLFAAAGGCALGALVGVPALRAHDRARAIRFALAGALGLLASTLNPDGVRALLAYTQAGVESAGHAFVVDEWRAFSPFEWPIASLPPAPLAWAITGCIVLATPILIALAIRGRLQDPQEIRRGPTIGSRLGEVATRSETLSEREPPGTVPGDSPLVFPFDAASPNCRSTSQGMNAARKAPRLIDPALVTLAAIGVVAPFVAVRFLWLALFPLLLAAEFWRWEFVGVAIRSTRSDRDRKGDERKLAASSAAAAACVALVPLYLGYSERPATPIGTSLERYTRAFDSHRYSAHAVWFLADSGAGGKLFHPYFMGGFLGYWLAPRYETFIDGSLNVPSSALVDYGRVQRAGHTRSIEAIEEVLDRNEIDFYIGIGLPTPPRPGRPWRYTTMDLARSPDWILVFRSLRGAVYMRRHPRNAENLERIAIDYERAGVPFDRRHGLDIAATLDRAPEWAIEHGLAPVDYPQLVDAANGVRPGPGPALRAIARDRLATTYAVLGLCERALAIDGPSATPTNVRPGVRSRRRQACLAARDGTGSPRATWLTPVEAGKIKGVERRPAVRQRSRP